MRLLSNLYKQRFITNESESRVINSNTLAYRILEEQSRALAKTQEPGLCQTNTPPPSHRQSQVDL